MAWRKLKIKSRINGYTITGYIGRGNYGEVWKAKPRIGPEVAVKYFAALSSIIRLDRLTKEIMREALAQAQLNHQNVVALIRGEPEKGYIMFELMKSSLKEKIKNLITSSDKLTTDTAIAIIKGCLNGLKAIHDKEIVHGDIKPANILMTEEDVPKISDFGLASILHKKKFPLPFFRGSSCWAAPEVLLGEGPTYQSDLFSMGIIFYLLLTNSHPFYPNEPSCLWEPEDRIADKSFLPKPVTDLEATTPEVVSQIITRLLQRDPDRRFKKVEEVLIALTELEAPETKEEPVSVGVPIETANEIAEAILDAKRLYFIDFTPPDALQKLKNVIDKFKDKGIRSLADAYSFSAFLHNYLGEWDNAVIQASMGVKVDPMHAESYMTRGYALMHKWLQRQDNASLANAKEDFNKALMLTRDIRKRGQIQHYLAQLPS
jgi:serine/threonine protein kinase